MLRGGSTVETKKSKYDTNPLDPEVERKAEESWGDRAGGGETQQVGGATRHVGDPPPAWTTTPNPDDNARQNVYSEAPTRRYDNPPLEAPYPSVFIPPTYAPPSQYSPPQQPQNVYQSPVGYSHPSRPVAGLGLAEKWALMMAYAPYGVPIDHPDLEPIWAEAAAHDLCIILHTFTVMPPYAPGGLDTW